MRSPSDQRWRSRVARSLDAGTLCALSSNLREASSTLSQLTQALPRLTATYAQEGSKPSVVTANIVDSATLTTYRLQVTNPGTATATYSVNKSAPVALVGNSLTLDGGRILVIVNTLADGSATISVQANNAAVGAAIKGFVAAYNAELTFLRQHAGVLAPNIANRLRAAMQLNGVDAKAIAAAVGQQVSTIMTGPLSALLVEPSNGKSSLIVNLLS